jgi:DNA-binding PadR family transcriptional regulator
MVHALFFGRHGRHRHGPGPGGFGWQGFGGRWGARTRRGDMKYLVLEALTEGPRHGYEIILAIEAKRGIRPSAGSIYPTLQMLEDGGFVSSTEVEGKRVYTITDAGRALLAERPVDVEDDDEDDEDAMRHRLKESAMKLGAAVMSARGSDRVTLERIREILDRARREVYTLLASDET